MEELDFNPHKGKESFRNNYKLHDISEKIGKNLLIQWGFSFNNFGEDKRYERVWEKGQDKPDVIISYKNKKALLDWKGKHKAVWIINRRAFMSYKQWQQKLNFPVFVFFGVFDAQKNLVDSRLARIDKHSYIFSLKREWDKNETVEFEQDLPKFTKANLVKLISED
jgi:hypothetical protein